MIQSVPASSMVDEAGEWVSLSQASRRVGLSRSRISQLRQEDPAFPPTRPTRSSLLVSWPAFERWFAHRPRRTRWRTLQG